MTVSKESLHGDKGPSTPANIQSPWENSSLCLESASTIKEDAPAPSSPPPTHLPVKQPRRIPSQQAPHRSNSLHDKIAKSTSNATEAQGFGMDFEGDSDPQNPLNWPVWYKGLVLAAISWGTFCVVVYSTSYTTGIADLGREFHVSSEPVITLGLTTYLFGLALGSMIFAPLSEMYGRRPMYIVGLLLTTILIIPCGVGHSLQELIIVRFFGAFFGSVMIAISPGTISDIAPPQYRALAFSLWAIGPLNGPTFGPIIGGFSTQYLGWRWTNWIVMILTGAAFGFISLIKESYTPVLLRQKAARRRKEEKDDRYWCSFDLKKTSFIESMKISLTRPFEMIITEPICLFWDIYIGIIYGILYLCFVAYPIVFEDIRGWSNGITGLSFLGIAVGCFSVLASEPILRKMIEAHRKDPKTGKPPPEAMVSVVCIAAILSPTGQLWFSWTCLPPVHWIVPILAGIPFGMGNTAIFIYATNYLAQSYGLYGASAMAGNSVIRSIIGGCLPLAGPKMYRTLNPHWAGTTLGLVQIACIPIPFLFYKYGYKIRMKSVLIRSLQEASDIREARRKMATIRSTDRAVDATKRASESGSKSSSTIQDDSEIQDSDAIYEKKDEESSLGLGRSNVRDSTSLRDGCGKEDGTDGDILSKEL